MKAPSEFSILAASSPKVWRAGTLTYTASGLALLFFWLLLGDFAWSMRDRSVWPMASWYLGHLKVPNLLFGFLLSSFPALVALFVGPVISVMSDRHRGRWGRRIPFLLITTPMAGAGMLGLALVPWISMHIHAKFPGQSEFVIALLCFGALWAVFELGTVIGQSVFGGLINDVVPREFLGRFYGLFRAVALIDGMIFNFWVMGLVPEYFTLILIFVAAFYTSAFMWVCLKVKEGTYPPPEIPESRETGVAGKVAVEIQTYCRECFSRSYYVLVFLLMMVAALAFSPVNVFSIPYGASLKVDMDMYGKSLALTYFISLCLSYPLGWLADRIHPLRVAMIMLGGYAVVAFFGALFATTPESFLVVWVLHGVLAGSYFTGAASLAQRLFPHQKFAQFASAAGICIAVGNVLLAPSVGMLLDWTDNQYRHTFSVACVLAVIALVLSGMVYPKFCKFGGVQSYAAPE